MGKRAAVPPAGETDIPCDLQVVFGTNLRDARVKAGLTQMEVAARTGLTPQYVSKVEKGQKNVTLRTMQVLALLLDHDVADFLRQVTQATAPTARVTKRAVRA